MDSLRARFSRRESSDGGKSSGVDGEAGGGTSWASDADTCIGVEAEASNGAGATGGVASGCGKFAVTEVAVAGVGGDNGSGIFSGEAVAGAAASGGAGDTRSLTAGVEFSLDSPTTNFARNLSSSVRLGLSGVPGPVLEDAETGGGVCVRGGETSVLRRELSGSPNGSSTPRPLPLDSERSCLAAPSTNVRRPENIEERAQVRHRCAHLHTRRSHVLLELELYLLLSRAMNLRRPNWDHNEVRERSCKRGSG